MGCISKSTSGATWCSVAAKSDGWHDEGGQHAGWEREPAARIVAGQQPAPYGQRDDTIHKNKDYTSIDPKQHKPSLCHVQRLFGFLFMVCAVLFVMSIECARALRDRMINKVGNKVGDQAASMS